MSWREVEHTADWSIVVDAIDLDALFLEAARGFYALADCEYGETVASVEFEVDGPDDETVLVAFLDELLFRLDVRHVAYNDITITRDGETLRAHAVGRNVTGVVKTIKAVTFHDLEITHTDSGCTATIVFDV